MDPPPIKNFDYLLHYPLPQEETNAALRHVADTLLQAETTTPSLRRDITRLAAVTPELSTAAFQILQLGWHCEVSLVIAIVPATATAVATAAPVWSNCIIGVSTESTVHLNVVHSSGNRRAFLDRAFFKLLSDLSKHLIELNEAIRVFMFTGSSILFFVVRPWLEVQLGTSGDGGSQSDGSQESGSYYLKIS